MTTPLRTRDRADRCPGVLRPWIAGDGGLVRIRTVGGRILLTELAALAEVAARYGDPRLHLTRRANLQLRGLPHTDGALPAEVVTAISATGLLPSPAHELVRNVMVSPLTGLSGGRADLRRTALTLDRLLCADDALAGLPGRFLFVLDDGRGDLLGRPVDLGLVALGADRVQLRTGSRHWGPVVPLDDAPRALLALAHDFLAARGTGPGAAWHVDELTTTLTDDAADPLSGVRSGPAAYGRGDGFDHREIPEGVLTPALLDAVLTGGHRDPVVVSPWHGLVLLDG